MFLQKTNKEKKNTKTDTVLKSTVLHVLDEIYNRPYRHLKYLYCLDN